MLHQTVRLDLDVTRLWRNPLENSDLVAESYTEKTSPGPTSPIFANPNSSASISVDELLGRIRGRPEKRRRERQAQVGRSTSHRAGSDAVHYIELTVEQLEHCAATGEWPWPDESPS